VSEPTLTELDLDASLWERVFTVAPLVLVGSREPDGGVDLAPKHLVAPMWGPYFLFVCSERHATYRNAVREGAFTVSWPALPTFPARDVEGVLLRGGYLFLECRLERTVDGFGENSLVIGRVVAAYADPESLRAFERDDAELIRDQPLLAYLYPQHFATIREGQTFPFPRGFSR
jgi:flavin reductase (DIM6/NTAB) family NADH-FMN oxidoreductase RutF